MSLSYSAKKITHPHRSPRRERKLLGAKTAQDVDDDSGSSQARHEKEKNKNPTVEKRTNPIAGKGGKPPADTAAKNSSGYRGAPGKRSVKNIVHSKSPTCLDCEVLVRINKESPDMAGGVHDGLDDVGWSRER